MFAKRRKRDDEEYGLKIHRKYCYFDYEESLDEKHPGFFDTKSE